MAPREKNLDCGGKGGWGLVRTGLIAGERRRPERGVL